MLSTFWGSCRKDRRKMAERALPGLKNPGPGQGGSKNQESTPSGDVGIEHGRTAFIYIVGCMLNWSYLGFEDTHTSTSRKRIYIYRFLLRWEAFAQTCIKRGQGVSVRRCLAICFPHSWWQHHATKFAARPCKVTSLYRWLITCIIIKCKSSKHDRTWHFNANHPKLFSFIGWHFWNGCFLWNIYGLRRINSNLSSNIFKHSLISTQCNESFGRSLVEVHKWLITPLMNDMT